ncbi:MAG: TIGR00266 family protein [Chloroflexi bacterium]|nr:TIGR00266 family protein [Chloroflexota bacterium]
MQTEIMYRPSYSIAQVTLGPNESLQVEAGSMVSMSGGVTMETKAQGGILKSLGRAILGQESFFINTFQADGDGGAIMVAPPLPGDLHVITIGGTPLMVQSGSYVASEAGVEVDTKFSGAKTFFASEGLFMLRAAGAGQLIVSSFGAIHTVELAAGQKYTIDTGHIVAFTEGMGFNVRTVGGIKSTLFSGEGLVVDLTGPGHLLMQTRSQDAFLRWLLPHIPSSSD